MVTCTETHLWISQPNWYLFYKYKKLLSQKQNTCVDKSAQTNIFTTDCLCSNILHCEHGVSFLLSPSRIHVLAHPWKAINVAIVDSRWRHNCCHWLWIKERHSPSNDAIWDLRHDLRRDLSESRWFSFVNTTWHGPGPSLKWDSVRVQAKSWVKSQVKTVSEYGPRGRYCWVTMIWPLLFHGMRADRSGSPGTAITGLSFDWLFVGFESDLIFWEITPYIYTLRQQ